MGGRKRNAVSIVVLHHDSCNVPSEASVTTMGQTPRALANHHSAEQLSTDELSSFIGIAIIVFPLSGSVQNLLAVTEYASSSDALSINLRKTIAAGEIIWQSIVCRGHAVVRCSQTVVVKIVPEIDDYTEYTSMQYLMQHGADIPLPEPLGLITSNKTAYIFMSFIPGKTIDKVWSKMHQEQKLSISEQLNDAFLKLRALHVPDNVSLGGVCSEGCKDTRRHTRICQSPISTCSEFEDFRFSNPVFGSPTYVSLLRRVSCPQNATIIFSHGDLRPENIMVQGDQHGNYKITGILDWEKSGFYPDYFECLKATSNMSPADADDWYTHLPPCASPFTYPQIWSADRIWDIHVA